MKASEIKELTSKEIVEKKHRWKRRIWFARV